MRPPTEDAVQIPRLLDARAVADALGCSMSAARRILKHDLPALIVGERMVRVRADDLAKYVEERRARGTAEEQGTWQAISTDGRPAGSGGRTTPIRPASGGASARASPTGR